MMKKGQIWSYKNFYGQTVGVRIVSIDRHDECCKADHFTAIADYIKDPNRCVVASGSITAFVPAPNWTLIEDVP